MYNCQDKKQLCTPIMHIPYQRSSRIGSYKPGNRKIRISNIVRHNKQCTRNGTNNYRCHGNPSECIESNLFADYFWEFQTLDCYGDFTSFCIGGIRDF